MIKLVVSDIDGTLVPEGTHNINPELFSVILELKNRGIQFAAASGRHWSSVDKAFTPIRERIFYIADNGGFMGIYNRALFVDTLPRDAAMEYIRDMKKVPGMEMVVSAPTVTYMDSKNEKFCSWIKNGYLYDVKMVEDVSKIDDEILKVAVFCENNLDSVYREAKERYEDYGNLIISGAAWVDYTPKQVNKGHALKVLQDSLNIRPEETMVFGDQLNDIEMMKQAYYSFAVSDGREEVRKEARFQADKSTRDGVLKVLKYLL